MKFKMTPKLKLAEMIYKNKEMKLTEKITYLKEIKNLTEDELEKWIEIDVLLEGPVGKVLKYGTAGLAAAVIIRKIKSMLNECKNGCRESFKIHKDREKFNQCILKCNEIAQRKMEQAKK
mgnify:CR=1 FL=1